MDRLEIYDLRCEALIDPVGVDFRNPRFTWKIRSDKRGCRQSAYQVIISEKKEEIFEGKGAVFDTGKMISGESAYCSAISFLESRKKYYWAVRIWDEQGQISSWSPIAFWENGLLYPEDWQARWIEPEQCRVTEDHFDSEEYLAATGKELFEAFEMMHQEFLKKGNQKIGELGLHPCPILRKEFTVQGRAVSAKVYATAHGLYRLYVNGKRVGNLELTPEITPYEEYLQYQTYDICPLLENGANVFAAELADGWWAGRLGTYGDSVQYGNTLALLAQIEICYEDGTRQILGTDEGFRSSTGGRRYADLRIGERFDANYEPEGWKEKGFDDSSWKNVIVCGDGYDNLVAQRAEPIRIIDRKKAVAYYTSPSGDRILDFGQAMAGNASLVLNGKKGQEICLTYFEQTDKDGNPVKNIMGRNCHQKEYYVFDRDGEARIQAAFSYRGFRYVILEGFDGELELEKQEARLIASDVDRTGWFSCNDERINRLMEAIRWSIISNTCSIPTDNSDRERAGWTGDAWMIAPTACWQYDLNAFYRRWLEEVRIEQTRNGEIPTIVPCWKAYQVNGKHAQSGWGDVSIYLSLLLYQKYGDIRILRENYQSMKAWIGFQIMHANQGQPQYIIADQQLGSLGDWLKYSATWDPKSKEFTYFASTIKWLMPTYYFIIALKKMSRIAEILNEKEDAIQYRILHENTVAAAQKEFFDSGRIYEEKEQGAIILALHAGIVPDEHRQEAAGKLAELIRENNGCLDTGFTSTIYILDELVNGGQTKAAFDLLFQSKCPSWLYEIQQGATGLWEAWSGITEDGKVNPVSFLQYANGVVGDWIFRNVGGIREDTDGTCAFLIEPLWDERFCQVETAYDSRYGRVQVQYAQKEDESIELMVEIPANASARILISKDFQILENGIAVKECRDVQEARGSDAKHSLEIGSGIYKFVCLKDRRKAEENV